MNGRAYRPCVAILLFDVTGRVLIAERNDVKEPAWQLPQGGIDEGETPRVAAAREMKEEIGTGKAEFLKEAARPIRYDLPPELLTGRWKKKWRGQSVKVVGFRFTGTDSDINLDTGEPEFRAWRWTELEEIPDLIVPFKRPLYENAVREFSEIRDRLRAQVK